MSRVCLDCAHDPCRPHPRPAHAGGHAAGAAPGRVARPPVRHGAPRDLRAAQPARWRTAGRQRNRELLHAQRKAGRRAARAGEWVGWAEDLYELTLEYLQDAAAHNVHHAEFFWNPPGTVHASCIAYPIAQAAISPAIPPPQPHITNTTPL